MTLLERLPTSVLRSLSAALAARPLCRPLRVFRFEVEMELLARELPNIAEDCDGHPSPRVPGWQ